MPPEKKKLKMRIIGALWFIFGIFPFWLGGYAYRAVAQGDPFMFIALFVSSVLFVVASTVMFSVYEKVS